MMKKGILFLIIFCTITLGNAQEWFTSFEVAKRLAMLQDKMLFVLWEGSLDYDYPVIIVDEKGNSEIVLLSKNESLNPLIWDNFIPVKLAEYEYATFSNKVKETKGIKYYNKLIDDSIKIMDVNGNILNVDDSLDKYYFFDENEGFLDIADFIKRYALNTSFLKYELENYSREKNFISTFYLASKYLDFAIFVQKDLRPQIAAMANLYFDESRIYLEQEQIENSSGLLQRFDLLKIKEDLILNNPRKALRTLRKLDEENIDSINKTLFSFLNYTTFKLLNKEDDAQLWKDKVSSLDIRMTGLILNNTIKSGNNN